MPHKPAEISWWLIGSIAVLLGFMALHSQFAPSPPPEPARLDPFNWDGDEIQYYAPGDEFKLTREAAALKVQSANQPTDNVKR